VAGLTAKQQAFVEAYLANGFNATAAARKAGYSERTAHAIGWENLRKPEIATLIQQGMAERAMSADEVLARIAEQARGTMDDFLDEDGKIDLKQGRERGKLHLVKTRSVTKEGERIELYSSQMALEILAKAHGLLIDRVDVNDVTDYADVSPAEQIAIHQAEIDRLAALAAWDATAAGSADAESGVADEPAA
jgi:phage terminase small subunit